MTLPSTRRRDVTIAELYDRLQAQNELYLRLLQTAMVTDARLLEAFERGRESGLLEAELRRMNE